MDSLTTHPSNAQQAKAFTAPSSLSFPGGAADVTPPSSEKDGSNQTNGTVNGQKQESVAPQQANGATPTPAATPAAAGQTSGVSGVVPQLQ